MTPKTRLKMPDSGGSIQRRWDALLDPFQKGDMSQPSFSDLADCLMAAGMAAEASRCRAWGLLEPPELEWKEAIREWNSVFQEADKSLGQACSEPNTNPASTSRDPEQIELMQVKALVDQGRLQEACDQLGRLSHQKGLPPNLCNRMAMLLEQKGDFWESESWYRTSLSSQTQQPSAWFALAANLLNQHVADEALEASQIGLELHPRHPWGLKLRQRSLMELKAGFDLDQLQIDQQLPFPIDPETLEALKQEPSWSEFNLSLPERLAWRHALRKSSSTVWTISLQSPAILERLASLELFGSDLRVMAFGCANAERFHQSLASLSFHLDAFGPTYQMRQCLAEPGLAIIGLSKQNCCPLALATCLNNPAIALLVRDGEIMEPPGRHRLLDVADWTLWVPQGTEYGTLG